MNRIIPYYEKLEPGVTAFIISDNKIISSSLKHEKFATDYCQGEDYDKLLSMFKSGIDVDLFSSSKLTKDELILYKYWLEQNEFNKRKMCSDFLVEVLGFDKILTNIRKTIVTTSLEPHVKFYNYYLMDWYIELRNRCVFNENTGLFEFIEPDISLMRNVEDRNYEEEINEIKSKVKLKDRHYFFK